MQIDLATLHVQGVHMHHNVGRLILNAYLANVMFGTHQGPNWYGKHSSSQSQKLYQRYLEYCCSLPTWAAVSIEVR